MDDKTLSLLKDIIVPLVGTLVATIAVIVTIRIETRKIRLARQHERHLKAEGILSDVYYGADLFQLLVFQWHTSQQINAAHLKEFHTSMNRLFEKIFSEPEIGRSFYDGVQFVSGKPKLFLLLAECRIRILNLTPAAKPDILVYFTLMTLQYIYDANHERRKELYAAMDAIRKSDPSLYDAFIVDPATAPLTSTTNGC